MRFQISEHTCSCGHKHSVPTTTVILNDVGLTKEGARRAAHTRSDKNYYVLHSHVNPGGARHSIYEILASKDEVEKVIKGSVGYLAFYYGEYFDLYVYENGKLKEKIDMLPYIKVNVKSTEINGSFRLYNEDGRIDNMTRRYVYGRTGIDCDQKILKRMEDLDTTTIDVDVDMTLVPELHSSIKYGEYADHIDDDNIIKFRYGIDTLDGEGGFMESQTFIESLKPKPINDFCLDEVLYKSDTLIPSYTNHQTVIKTSHI